MTCEHRAGWPPIKRSRTSEASPRSDQKERSTPGASCALEGPFPARPVALIIPLLLLAAAGCTDVAEGSACDNVCVAYQTCVDDDVDVDICASNCTFRANSVPGFLDEVLLCESCVGTRTCVAQAEDCDVACAVVYPTLGDEEALDGGPDQDASPAAP